MNTPYHIPEITGAHPSNYLEYATITNFIERSSLEKECLKDKIAQENSSRLDAIGGEPYGR